MRHTAQTARPDREFESPIPNYKAKAALQIALASEYFQFKYYWTTATLVHSPLTSLKSKTTLARSALLLSGAEKQIEGAVPPFG
eukprot:2372283-Pleurochrysis_carterae.AAC.1